MMEDNESKHVIVILLGARISPPHVLFKDKTAELHNKFSKNSSSHEKSRATMRFAPSSREVKDTRHVSRKPKDFILLVFTLIELAMLVQ